MNSAYRNIQNILFYTIQIGYEIIEKLGKQNVANGIRKKTNIPGADKGNANEESAILENEFLQSSWSVAGRQDSMYEPSTLDYTQSPIISDPNDKGKGRMYPMPLDKSMFTCFEDFIKQPLTLEKLRTMLNVCCETIGIEESVVEMILRDVVMDSAMHRSRKNTAQADELRINEALGHIFNLVSHHIHFSVTIDNSQWLGARSLGLVLILRIAAPEILLMLSTLPMAEYNDPTQIRVFRTALSHTQNILYVKLNGLDAPEISTLILREIGSTGIESIEESVLKRVMHITNGMPGLIIPLALTMKENMKRDFALGKRKEPASQAVQRSAMSLDVNIAGSILNHFDKLALPFQEILQAASCIGLDFSLEDLVGALGHENAVIVENRSKTYQEVLENFASLDRFNFLRARSDVSIGKRDNAPADFSTVRLAFRQAIVASVFYQTIPFADRKKYHLRLARYFESRMRQTDAHGVQHIMAIVRHYCLTDDDAKKLNFWSISPSRSSTIDFCCRPQKPSKELPTTWRTTLPSPNAIPTRVLSVSTRFSALATCAATCLSKASNICSKRWDC